MRHNLLDEYLDDLERRLKSAPEQKEAEVREVRGHLEALIAAHIQRGHDSETAMNWALQQFGKAEQLSGDLNHVTRQKEFKKSAQWIGKSLLVWCGLWGAEFAFFSSMNNQPTDFPYLLNDRLVLSAVMATPALFGGHFFDKAVKKWRSRRQIA